MNKKSLIFFLFRYLIPILIITMTSCGGESSSNEGEKIYLLEELDEAPEFVGGYGEFANYINQAINDSPEGTFESIEEKVFVNFIINEDGKITQVKVITPLSTKSKNAIESILTNSPNWEPGKVDGISVSSFQILPLRF